VAYSEGGYARERVRGSGSEREGNKERDRQRRESRRGFNIKLIDIDIRALR